MINLPSFWFHGSSLLLLAILVVQHVPSLVVGVAGSASGSRSCRQRERRPLAELDGGMSLQLGGMVEWEEGTRGINLWYIEGRGALIDRNKGVKDGSFCWLFS